MGEGPNPSTIDTLLQPTEPKEEETEKTSLPQYTRVQELSPVVKSLYGLKKITRESTSKAAQPAEQYMRSLALRNIRADIYKQIKETKDRDERKVLLDQAKERDRIEYEFLHNQHDVHVDMGELGTQSSRYVVLKPSEDRVEKDEEGNPILYP